MIKLADIPPLPHGCNSWIVVRRDTGKPAFETTSTKVLQKLRPEAVEVWTAMAWLQHCNRQEEARRAIAAAEKAKRLARKAQQFDMSELPLFGDGHLQRELF